MKVKIQAGAEIDTLTREELRAELTAWRGEIGRGVKFRKSSVTTVALAGNLFNTGGTKDTEIGPNAGMILAITSVWVSGAGFTAGTDTFSVFVNEIAPSNLRTSGLTRGKDWAQTGLVLVGNDRLFTSGTAAGAAGTAVAVAWSGIEVPEQLAWMLL